MEHLRIACLVRRPWLAALLFSSILTAQPAGLVRDINRGPVPNPSANRTGDQQILTVGTITYFAARSYGMAALWVTDGSRQGTRRVPGTALLGPSNMAALGSQLIFVGGEEIWKSDGTAAGTVAVQDKAPRFDVWPASGWLLEDYGAVVANGQYFVPSPYGGLFKSDGTSAGTTEVKTASGAELGEVRYLTNVRGTVYFVADDGQTGMELWKTDGTKSGTVMVKDIVPGTGGDFPEELVDFNGTLFFRGHGLDKGSELWKSDGTANGTVLVKDINPGRTGSGPYELTVAGDKLFFRATTPANGQELWISDGTETGTRLVKDIVSGEGSSSPSRLTAHGGKLFFRATTSANGQELWVSDGTETGTTLVQDIWPGASSSNPGELSSIGKLLYFVADDGEHGREPWSPMGPRRALVWWRTSTRDQDRPMSCSQRLA